MGDNIFPSTEYYNRYTNMISEIKKEHEFTLPLTTRLKTLDHTQCEKGKDFCVISEDYWAQNYSNLLEGWMENEKSEGELSQI